MSRFRYQAINANDEPLSGELLASSQADAIAQLEAQGLRVVSTEPTETKSAESTPKTGLGFWLTDGDFVETADRIADVVKTGLPLAAGLRALSEEAPTRRLRRILRNLAMRIERGESVEHAVEQVGSAVPLHVRGILQVGLRSGQLSTLLEQYLVQTRMNRNRRRQAMVRMLYPAILLVFGFAIVSAYMVWIMPGFKEIFDDFGTELPGITVLLIGLSDFTILHGWWVGLTLFLLTVAAWVAILLIGGRKTSRRLFCMIPLVGPFFRFSALAEFCQVLAILVENQVRLPQALEMAGVASNDADLHDGCVHIANDVTRGEPLDEAAFLYRQFPPNLLQIFRWSGRRDAFPDALRAAGSIFESRARAQAGLFTMILPPIVIVSVGLFFGFLVIASFMPLIKLLNDLSFWM